MFGPEGAEGTANGEWHHYAGDRASSKYSPLNQINRSNAEDLEIAWRWTSPDEDLKKANRRLRAGPFKATPLMVDGVLYTSTGLSQVVAIDPATGETLWIFDPASYEAGRPANTGYIHRGLDYWTDGEKKRLLIATGGKQLISIDMETHLPDPEFGDNGRVDLNLGLGREVNTRNMGYNAPVVVCRNTIVVGSIISDGPTTPKMPPGHVRGYDVHTGEMKWIFHTIPQDGEFGVATWEDGSWEYSGNTNVWTMMSVDEELGYVYLPTSTPTNDWYGGHRLGDNLFAESLVCLDAETGERVWHFQAVHHGLWDYDFPAAPNLIDIKVGGKHIKAVAQVSKQGFTYVFDRATGEPVWPIVERPVPQTRVPGEKTSLTQPFPTKPPPFERQGMTEDDLIDFTPELRADAIEIMKKYEMGPLFTPPILEGENGKIGTVYLPSSAGGANWRGAAYDPETQTLYIPSMTWVMVVANKASSGRLNKFKYTRTGAYEVFGSTGLPIVKPPYGRITAIDMNKGRHVWQVADGDGPRDHPDLKHLNLPRLGNASHGVVSNGGGVLTRELFMNIQATYDPRQPTHTGTGGWLRAYDKVNGDLVSEYRIDDNTPHGTPMTYMHEGKQYVVFAMGGSREPAELIAFALP